MIICPRCKEEKALGDFYVLRTRASGRQGYCKACQKETVKASARANPIRIRYDQARIRDRQSGWETCSRDEWRMFFASDPGCTYCGAPSARGADRIDNNSGHVIGNMVPCCYPCNVTRGDRFSYDEMISVLGPALRAIREARASQSTKPSDGLRSFGLFT
jgi:hypothetical protein